MFIKQSLYSNFYSNSFDLFKQTPRFPSLIRLNFTIVSVRLLHIICI